MKIEEFIKEVSRQITSACQEQGVSVPQNIEYTIQINERGEVCTEHDTSIGTMKVTL